MVDGAEIVDRDIRSVRPDCPTGNSIVVEALMSLAAALEGHRHRWSEDERVLVRRALRACGREV